jgi:hypothetical protein
MKTLAKKIGSRITWKNAKWFMMKNVQSWVLQGAVAGILAVVGVSALASLVSAKVAAYVVFAAQCVNAARSGE